MSMGSVDEPFLIVLDLLMGLSRLLFKDPDNVEIDGNCVTPLLTNFSNGIGLRMIGGKPC